MKRISILIFMMALMSFAFAQEEAKEWFMLTNTGETVKMVDVDYLLAADDCNQFSVVMKGGTTIDNVSKVTFSDVTAVTLVVADEGLSLFPNPVSRTLTITGATAGSEVQVLSLDGKQVISTIMNDNTVTIDVAALPSGYYLLKSQNSVVKFIKK
ncbi:MAG: T9SS type A sorting domain-containing protein [Bacteroidaceae bacterium]|nr:T9SS type A sorting domain-containing protein [Bacteroidaceae bacterium]